MTTAVHIRATLPQRYPLLLVDRVLLQQPGHIETIKAVTSTEPCYADVPDDADHADYRYPVSLLIESFGQSAALLWLSEHRTSHAEGVAAEADATEQTLLFVGARDYEVHGYAYPGDVVRHVVRLERVVADTAFASGESWVGDRKIATVGSLMAARRPTGALHPPGQPPESVTEPRTQADAGRVHFIPTQEDGHGRA